MDRLQSELLRALGKPRDHADQGVTGGLGQLARGWLEAETAGHLIVLRAHQIHGLALPWLLSLATTSRFHLWLISPKPLPAVDNHAGQAAVDTIDPADAVISLARAHTDHHGDCHDLNNPIRKLPADNRANGGLTLAAAVRLRRLYHLDTAAIAAALLMGRPEPQTLAATTIHVAPTRPPSTWRAAP